MRLFRRDGVWHCVFYGGDGKRHRRSTRCTDKAAAERVGRQLERDAADPAHAAAAKAKLTDAFTLLLNDRLSKAKANPPKASIKTVDFYRVKAGHWRRILEGEDGELGPFPLAKLGPRHVDRFINQRRREGASEHTIHKELTTLRAALKLALRAGIWQGNVPEIVPSGFATGYEPRTRFLAPIELAKLLGELEPDRAARVAFIVATSACWNETERARRSHVAADCSSVFLDGTKRKQRRREVPIASDRPRNTTVSPKCAKFLPK